MDGYELADHGSLAVHHLQEALAYTDGFWVLMISLSAVPPALMLRKVKLGGAMHVGH
jgi:hypothetical protein